jgi:alginate O-acetyltransferase complex protein AlgJ
MKRLRDPQWALILLFAGILASVPLVQMAIEARTQDGIRAFDVFSHAPTSANLRAYEQSMEAANWAAQMSRPWIQYGQFAWLKDGGEKAAVGSGGWYFYKPGVSYLLSRPPSATSAGATNDPLRAITDFRDRLAERGIRLLLVPVPNKESIYPDRLTSRAEPRRCVIAPRTRDLLDRLRRAQVEVVDLFKEVGQARQPTGPACETPLYLAQDTHWSPLGVDLAAKATARRLLELGWVQPGAGEYSEKPVLIRRLGDVLRMLQVPMIERTVTP